MDGHGHAPYTTYRDDPDWQAAQADYIADGDDYEEAYQRRIKAAYRMREIERKHEEKGQ